MRYTRTEWVIVLLIIISYLSLFFFLLGVRPLFAPDEGRYAEIAREMVETGNYITPYLNGIKYFEKPILFYWMSAAAIKIGGLNLWSLRSVNALLSLLGGIATFLTAQKLYDFRTAAIASIILATTTLYFSMGHMINLDLAVSVFISLCLYAFILGWHTEQKGYFILSGLASGLAVLTKGLIGLVLPGLIIFAWIIIYRQWRVFKIFPFARAILMFAFITFPWHYLVAVGNPEFSYFYFIEQHFLRYATLAIGHYQPSWFFIPVLMAGFFPWIVFLPLTVIRTTTDSNRNRPLNGFLWLWAIIIFLFFSFSHSKLIPYILPIFPALAVLTAKSLSEEIKHPSLIGKFGFILLFALGVSMTCVLLATDAETHFANPSAAKTYLSLASIVLMIGFFIMNIAALKDKVSSAIIILSITMCIFLLILLIAIPAIETRSIKTLADTIKPRLQKNDVVITYNQYYQDLPFYLERTVSILNWRNEMTFGSQHQQNSRSILINDQDFHRLFNSKRRVYVLISKKELPQMKRTYPHQKFYILKSTTTIDLLSNQVFSEKT